MRGAVADLLQRRGGRGGCDARVKWRGGEKMVCAAVVSGASPAR